MDELWFTSPMFFQYPQPLLLTELQIPNNINTTSLSFTPTQQPLSTTLPDRPTTVHIPPPPGVPPSTTISTTRTICQKKTRHHMVKLRQEYNSSRKQSNQHLRSYISYFGTIKNLIDVLPVGPITPPSHRDYNFVQGKTKSKRYQP